MNSHPAALDENYLLNLQYDVEQLKSIQKCSASRVQIVSFKGNKALKSFQDSNRKLRVVIASLLIKIFGQFSHSNRDRLQRFKKIVYSSKLQKITEQKGIPRECLLKVVALQFKKLGSAVNLQMDIIRMFNCSPFFDQILFSALREENPLLQQSDCQISSWLDREMSIKILWNEQYFGQEKEEQMCLVGLGEQFHASKDCKSLQCNYKTFQQYLRFSSQQYHSNVEQQVNQIYDRNTKTLFSYPLSPEQKTKNGVGEYMSIETLSPSSKKMNFGGKQNSKQMGVTPEIKLFDTPVNSLGVAKKQSRKQSKVVKQKQNNEVAVIKLRRNSKSNDGNSSLWKMLCCGNI